MQGWDSLWMQEKSAGKEGPPPLHGAGDSTGRCARRGSDSSDPRKAGTGWGLQVSPSPSTQQQELNRSRPTQLTEGHWELERGDKGEWRPQEAQAPSSSASQAGARRWPYWV